MHRLGKQELNTHRMKYTVGDTILLLHSLEEGEVMEIINEKMVLVKVKGVQFPVHMDQIDFPYFHRFSQKRKQSVKKKIFIDEVKPEKQPREAREEKGTFMQFVPVFHKNVFDEDIVEKMKLYLVNETAMSYEFDYEVLFAGQRDFHLNNRVEPFSNFYLHDLDFEELNDSPKFEFWFKLVPPNKKKVEQHRATIRIKAKNLFKQIEEMRLENLPSFSYELFQSYPNYVESNAPAFPGLSNVYDISAARSRMEAARSVIDLHIDKLVDNWKGMSNREILSVQLREFEKYYQLAVNHHLPSFTVVHGIGKGVLREKIHEILKHKKEVKSFVNQYHASFGFGATEIYFN